jgi:hypothetical protein
MAQSCVFSVVATGATATILNSGAIGVPTGATASISPVGPVVTLGSTSYVSFSGQSAAVTSNFTAAGIFYFTNLGTGSFINTGGSATGCSLSLNASNQIGIVYTAVNRISSTVVPATNTSYFIAASRTQTTGNFAIVNLSTGQTFTSTVTGGTGAPSAPAGTFTLGASYTTNTLIGGYAAAMFSPVYTSLAQLQQWARQPWLFWYP